MHADNFRASAPAIAPLRGASLPPVESTTLDNGVRLYALNGTPQPINMVSVVRRGGNAEFPNQATAQLLLAAMGEGTASRSGSTIAQTIDGCGSWLKTGVYGHHSVVSMFSLNSRVEHVLPVLVDILENPAFPDHELEMKKAQIAQQLGVQWSKVSFRADAALQRLLFGENHPLARVATAEDVMKVTRKELLDAMASMRSPRDTYLFTGGNMTNKVTEAISNAMNGLRESDVTHFKNRIVTPKASEPCVERVDVPDAVQSALSMGIPVVGRHHPDYPLLHVAVIALGGYFGSRLMMNLREEKGFTYGVNASLMGVHEGAWLKISLECSDCHVDAAMDEVRRELVRLADNPPMGEELERMRRAALMSHLETLDSPLDVVAFYRNMVLSDMPSDYFEAKQRAILSVTPDDISRMASIYLSPDQLRISVAGRFP